MITQKQVAWFVVGATFFALQSPVHSQDWKASVSHEVYFCGAVDMKAFFANYNKQACIGYDLSESKTYFELTIGMGVGAGAKMEVIAFGAGADLKLGYRVKIKVEGGSKEEIIAACKSNDSSGKKFRGLLLDKIKLELLNMSDDDLKRVGLKREDVNELKDLPAFELVLAKPEEARKFEELLKKSQKIEKKGIGK